MAMPWSGTMPQHAAFGQAKEGVQEGAQSQSNDPAQNFEFLSGLMRKSGLSVVLQFMSQSPEPYLTSLALSFCILI